MNTIQVLAMGVWVANFRQEHLCAAPNWLFSEGPNVALPLYDGVHRNLYDPLFLEIG